jgi:oligopeptide/dipeptide ABC transporter ATP-binding protein
MRAPTARGRDVGLAGPVRELLELVSLPASAAAKYPHEFSGGPAPAHRHRPGHRARARAGHRRRAGVALDVSVQAQVVNLLEELQTRLGLTYVVIAHDLAVVRHISDEIGVMYLGSLVEQSPSEELYTQPLHPYTISLISAIPVPDPDAEDRRERILLAGDLPSPAAPPPGCRFHTRCPFRQPTRCHDEVPVLRELAPAHRVACHWAEDVRDGRITASAAAHDPTASGAVVDQARAPAPSERHDHVGTRRGGAPDRAPLPGRPAKWPPRGRLPQDVRPTPVRRPSARQDDALAQQATGQHECSLGVEAAQPEVGRRAGTVEQPADRGLDEGGQGHRLARQGQHERLVLDARVHRESAAGAQGGRRVQRAQRCRGRQQRQRLDRHRPVQAAAHHLLDVLGRQLLQPGRCPAQQVGQGVGERLRGCTGRASRNASSRPASATTSVSTSCQVVDSTPTVRCTECSSVVSAACT